MIVRSPRVAPAAFYLLAFGWLLANCALAQVVDDTWTDGTRTDPASPVFSENGIDADADGDIESAWYESSNGSLAVGSGTLTASAPSSSSRTWWTFFTNTPSAPASLTVGQTLKITATFTLTGVSSINTARGFNIGLYDFSEGVRSTGSGSPDGSGIRGYLLSLNFGQTFGIDSPLQIRERTNLSSTELLSSSGVYTTLSAGGGSEGDPAFNSAGPYTLEFSATRTASGTEITATLSGPGGWMVTHTATDDTPVISFDGMAIRATKGSETAGSIAFSRFKIEIGSAIPVAPMITSPPQSQEVTVGQDAAFSVTASGTAPLSYQWHKNGSPLSGATGSSLMLTNAQSSDAGNYTVSVSNDVDSVMSDPATLTVSLPTPPSITTQPQSRTVATGSSTTFTVVADGSPPLTYQWKKNGGAISGATDAGFTLANVQSIDAGGYTVVVSNTGGTATSSTATLTVSAAVAPAISSHPQSQSVTAGQSVNFSVVASGMAPLGYQWRVGGSNIPGATNSSYAIPGAQAAHAGSYTVMVSDAGGSVISNPAMLSVTTTGGSSSQYNLTGFATVGPGTTGGGQIAETNSAYKKVTTPLELANALIAFNKTGSVKVIEIMNDLDLGWNEIGSEVRDLPSSPFVPHATAKLHPRLITTGVSKVDVKYSKGGSGLTIFSANGAAIRHATLNIKNTSNIIVRNLKFDEMWEWDEATKGNYDSNDWDFIDLGNGGTVNNVWIDHCTFTKAYDGVVDVKGGSYNVTFSWNRYVGDDGATNSNSFVRQQLNLLEANKPAYPMYNYLRTKFTLEEIFSIIQGQDKTHLIGANSLNSENADHSLTMHHQWFQDVWDRLPRLRAGNVHNYNIYVDDAGVLAARRLRDSRGLNSTYNFNPPINGSISTENGAVLVEKSVYIDCLWPLRNNQTNPSNSTYTGKIKALDMIYTFHNPDGTTTNLRGNSTEPGTNPLGPTQANTYIPFSWNLTGNQLPYAYTMDDPANLLPLLQAGAGAGALAWSKDNWLKTTYAATPSAPTIVASPANLTVPAGGSATFNIAAHGTGPFSYQWRKGGTNLSGETSAGLAMTDLALSDAAEYSVVVSNSQGSATSAPAILTVTPSFSSWQDANFTAAELADPNISGPNAILTPDGVINRMKYALGVEAHSSATPALPKMETDSEGRPVFIYRRVAGATDITYLVKASTTLSGWSVENITHQRIAEADAQGIEVWEARYTGPEEMTAFYRLEID